jgi:hypothetical protein
MSSDEGFTARLNRLFETVRSDDGKPFTNAEIKPFQPMAMLASMAQLARSSMQM